MLNLVGASAENKQRGVAIDPLRDPIRPLRSLRARHFAPSLSAGKTVLYFFWNVLLMRAASRRSLLGHETGRSKPTASIALSTAARPASSSSGVGGRTGPPAIQSRCVAYLTAAMGCIPLAKLLIWTPSISGRNRSRTR